MAIDDREGNMTDKPWEAHHTEAHDKAVYRLTEARGNLVEAAGWIEPRPPG